MAELRRRRDAVARRRSGRAAARHGRAIPTSPARSPAGAAGHRHLPSRRGKAGSSRGSEEERKRILADALALGAEYVDIEWRAGFDDLIAQARRPADRPVDARFRRRAGRPRRARAGDARRPARRSSRSRSTLDAPERLRAAAAISAPQRRVRREPGAHRHGRPYGVGDARARRRASDRPGPTPGRCSDIGQIDARARCSSDYRFRSIDRRDRDLRRRRRIRSRTRCRRRCTTPRFAPRGVDAVYLPLPAASADDFVDVRPRASASAARASRFRSRSSLFDRVDEVDSVARRIGAINTIRVERRPLDRRQHRRERIPRAAARAASTLTGLRASVLGAGGAARAVAVALAVERLRGPRARAQSAAGRRDARC